MSTANNKAVFLSYASQDAEAVRRITEALRTAGVEVWFDQNELVGGDAWDAKIRGQIKNCALFMPVISAATQLRLEGYFRLEWKLAAQRTHTMADAKPFLLPVVIDATRDGDAHVPEEFRAVQWTRLPGGEADARFCTRVQNLVGGVNPEHGRDAHVTSSPRAHGQDARAASKPRRPARRWLLPAVIGVAGFAAVAIWQPWKTGSLPAPANATSTAPLSEARQLTLKARALIDDDLMAVRENFRLADEFCQQATELDSKDGEVWATRARVSVEMIQRNFDATPQRREAARGQAERAIRLAPNSIEARLAMAAYFAVTMETEEAERRLRDLLKDAPRDARVALALAQELDRLGRWAEASDLRLKSTAFGGSDPRPLLQEAGALLGRGRFVEAEAWVDRAHALAPTWSSYGTKLRLVGMFWGDLEAAKPILDQVPPAYLREGDPALVTAQIWLWRGEPEKALDVLRRLPGDFFEGDNAVRPKGFYSGWAHQLAGRPLAAHAEWNLALAAVVRRLAAEPNDALLLKHQALLLALTGQKDEADKVHRLRLEIAADPVAWRGTASVVTLAARRAAGLLLDVRHQAGYFLAVDKREDAIRVLQEAEMPQGAQRALHLNNLRYDPWFAPIRTDPRIQKIIAEGEAWLREQRAAGATPAGAKSAAIAGRFDAKSVAVLAFENLSDDKANEYFSDGISEELINALGRVPGLTVKGSTSAFYFKGRTAMPAEIARQLGVAYLVRGSVGKDGSKVRIAARLTRTEDDSVVWASEPVTRELRDVFALQQEIATHIAQNLQLKLGVERGVAKTVNPEAHRLVLEGRYFLNQRDRGFAQAERAFEQALRIDADFADAHSGLATVRIVRASYQHLGEPAALADLARGRVAARRAIELDPAQVQAHSALGYEALMSGRAAESGEHFRQALALNPNDPSAHHWHAHLLAFQGRLDLALAENERAVQLDPLSFSTLWIYARQLRQARQPAKALEIVRRCLSLRPDFAAARGIEALELLALGRKGEAMPILRSLAQTPRDSLIAGPQFVWALRMADLAAEATKVADELVAAGENVFGVLVASGRAEQAFVMAADTTTVGPFNAVAYYWDPMFDAVRMDPRFQRRIADAGLTEYYQVAQATLARLSADPRR